MYKCRVLIIFPFFARATNSGAHPPDWGYGPGAGQRGVFHQVRERELQGQRARGPNLRAASVHIRQLILGVAQGPVAF
jgi:hypothetical protein